MKKIIAFVLAFMPSLAFAQSQLNNINDVAQKGTNIGNMIIAIAISLSVLWIIINIVRYLIAGGEDDRKKGGWAVFYGVLGLFLILSIWGLVNILKSSFATQDRTPTQKINETATLPNPVGI